LSRQSRNFDHLEHWRGSQKNRVLIKQLRFFCLTVQAFAQSAAPVFPNPGKTSMSKDNEYALGIEVAAQVYHQMPVLPDHSPAMPTARFSKSGIG
jgi:hypothetical protein